MSETWGASIIAKLRTLGVTQKKLAKLCGYSEAYVCQVLRGKKNTQNARKNIEHTIESISGDIQERRG